MKNAVVLYSAGVDSTVALRETRAREDVAHVLAMVFDYGQTLDMEVSLARHWAVHVHNVRGVVVDLPMYQLAPDCALLRGSTTPIPMDRHPVDIDAGIPPTYVPFRNGIFLAWAASWMEGHGYKNGDLLVCGGNGLNSGQYPDDTEEFGHAMERAIHNGSGFRPNVWFPNSLVPKDWVVGRGLELGVNMAQTYSCYRGNAEHCGHCDSCYQRAKAFNKHGLDLEGYPVPNHPALERK